MGTPSGSVSLTRTCWMFLWIGLGMLLSPVNGWMMHGAGAGLRLWSSSGTRPKPRLSPKMDATPLSMTTKTTTASQRAVQTQLQASNSQDIASKSVSHILHFTTSQDAPFMSSSSLALTEEDDTQWQPTTTKMLSNSFQSSTSGQTLGSATASASNTYMSSLLHFNQAPGDSSNNVRQKVDQLLQEADEVLDMANSAMGEVNQSLKNATQTASSRPSPVYERPPLSPLLHFRNQLDTSATGTTPPSTLTTSSVSTPSTHTELPKGPAVTLAEQVAARLQANQQAKQMADDLAKMQQQVDHQRAQQVVHQQEMEQAKAQEMAQQQAEQQQELLEEQQAAQEQAKRQAEQATAEQVAQVKAATTTTNNNNDDNNDDNNGESSDAPPSEESTSSNLPTEIEAQRESHHAEFEKEKASMDAEFEGKEMAETDQEPPAPAPAPAPQPMASDHNIAAMEEKARNDAMEQRMKEELERWAKEEDGTIAPELVGVMSSTSSSDEQQEEAEVQSQPETVEIVDGVAQFNDTALRHAEMDKRIEAELEQWKLEDAAAVAAASEPVKEDEVMANMTQKEIEEAEAMAQAIASKYNVTEQDWEDDDVPSLSTVLGQAMEEIKASDVLDEEEGMKQAMEWFEESLGGKIQGLHDDDVSSEDSGAPKGNMTHAEKEQASLDTLETMMSAAREAAESIEEDLKRLEASGVNLKDPSQPKRKKKRKATPTTEFGDPLEAMTVAGLKDELRKRGLKVSGRKAELIARLREAQFAED